MCEQNEVNQNVPPLPSDVDLDKFKEALLTDNFAGSMLDYLMHDNLPADDVKARNIVLQTDQFSAHEGLLYHIWHSPAKKTYAREKCLSAVCPCNLH